MVVVYVSHRVQLIGGVGEERALRLEMFVLTKGQKPRHLPRSVYGDLIRAICSAERQALPDPKLLDDDLVLLDAEMMATARLVAKEDVETIPVVGVWPVACFSVSVP